MLAAKSHASVSISPPPSCSNTEQSNKNHNAAGSNSGLFIRDAQQINNDITKLASVVAAAAGETNGVSILAVCNGHKIYLLIISKKKKNISAKRVFRSNGISERNQLSQQ